VPTFHRLVRFLVVRSIDKRNNRRMQELVISIESSYAFQLETVMRDQARTAFALTQLGPCHLHQHLEEERITSFLRSISFRCSQIDVSIVGADSQLTQGQSKPCKRLLFPAHTYIEISDGSDEQQKETIRTSQYCLPMDSCVCLLFLFVPT